MDNPFTISQDVFKTRHPDITVIPLLEHESETSVQLDAFLGDTHLNAIGVAAAYEKCKLVCVALASPLTVVVFCFSSPQSETKQSKKKKQSTATMSPGRGTLAEILTDPHLQKHGLNMDRLVTSLFLDYQLHLSQGFDLRSLVRERKRKISPVDDLAEALGGWDTLASKDIVRDLFAHEEHNSQATRALAMRAWACIMAGTRPKVAQHIAAAPKYNTDTFSVTDLAVLSKLQRDQDMMDAMKPTKVKNDVEGTFLQKNRDLHLQQTRFSTRMRVSTSQQIVVEFKPGDSSTGTAAKMQQVSGRAMGVNGKAARVQVRGTVTGAITGVYTVGKEDPTSAEDARAQVIRTSLLRTSAFLRLPLTKAIWLPMPSAKGARRVALAAAEDLPPIASTGRPLNTSQETAVRSMMNNELISLIHGGPGTGKTTVIAATVMTMVSGFGEASSGIWLVAQSNVAVKNIAEKLASCDFWDFRLLVSKDFHFDWHEHLYTKIEERVIRADQIKDHIVGVERKLGGARVMLCTLSTMSNNLVRQAGVMRLVPVQTVIVDEASQIEIGDYLPLIHTFETDLRKLVFIGDDKQLPPYGQEDIPNLQSIFELKHLRTNEVFLDTQYRMPLCLGNFISHHVYKNRLKSQHSSSARSAVQFVDIEGTEKQMGKSWINEKEIHAMVHLTQILQNTGKSFRIITPYDAQRTRIENALKAANLKWEDKVFNVDSFQGNEDDYILVSVVRTNRVGFLSNERRTNVMLSRCKKGMLLCANRKFVTQDRKARKTLVGKLAHEWMNAGTKWISWTDLLAGRL